MKKQFYSIAALALMCASALHATNLTGLTFLRPVAPFDNGSPLMVAVTETVQHDNKVRHNKHGQLQVAVFGGQNASQATAAAYYMPSDYTTWTVNDAPTATPVMNFMATNIGLMASATWTDTAGVITNGTAFNVQTPTSNAITDGVTIAGAKVANTLNTSLIRFLASDTANGVGNTANSAVTWATLGAVLQGAAVDIEGGTNKAGTPGTNSKSTTFGQPAEGIYITTDGTQADAGNLYNDVSQDTSVLKAWNFGITNAAVWSPTTGFTAAAFESTIAPNLQISNAGAAISYRHQFSDDPTGFFLKGSTALQYVRSNWQWNENVVSPVDIADTNYTNWTTRGFPAGDTVAPLDLTQAFAQEAWLYGKVDGAQHTTRLADIELLVGYEFINEATHHTNGYLGIVIPTGNKAKGVYLAEPMVGNGGHFGIMYGGTLEIQMSHDEDFIVTTRIDGNFRYLFQNTQVRALDLKDKPWSRYMMVWPDYATFATASTTTAQRYSFTPGINVFTQSVKVTPGSQLRINSAIMLESAHFKGELGCGILSRQAEKVILANAWAAGTVALAACNPTGVNNNSFATVNPGRTIFNNAVLDQVAPAAASFTSGTTPGNETITQAEYIANCVEQTDLNLDSAASPASLSYIPYLALGYAWGEDRTPGFVHVGGSYEFSLQNTYNNQWQVWAKLGLSF